MARTPAQAVAASRTPKAGLGGRCLQYVRTLYGIPAREAGARLAWKAAKYRVATSSTAGMPVGAILFMDKSTSYWGHVALYVGNGRMATTDSQRRHTYITSVQSWVNYGWRVTGWSADLNGVTVPELKRVYDRVKGKTSTSAATGKIRVDGYWGKQTKMRWQQVLGTKVDGVISKPYSQMVAKIQQGLGLKVTGRWDRHLTLALQKRYGTTQDGKTSKPSQWVRKLQERLNRGTW